MTNSPFLNSVKFNKPELAIEPNWAAHSDAIEKFETFRSTLELALSEQLETLTALDTQHDSELTYAQEQVGWLYDQLASAKEELAQEKASAKVLENQITHLELSKKSVEADLDSAWQTQLEMQESLIAQQKEIESLRQELSSLNHEPKTPSHFPGA